ncbi:MAG: hypothetical protein VX726_09015 [Planctomycetota bacterium]|nr:hypothetical protein [Planctomycetota bacterium]MEE2895862.1 hypothetical protein [Planctomycetota bacterium]
MFHRNLKGLLLLNGLLVAMLAAITFAPTAEAQQRFRGKYAMVSGRAQGTVPYLLYIVDQNSRQLVAVRYNVQQDVLEGMGYRDLVKDAVTIRQNRK